MPEAIVTATTPRDYEAFAEVVREYVEFVRSRYVDEADFVESVFTHQSLDDELKILATAYGPPAGQTLLAVRDGLVVGAVAHRSLPDGSCEMKRLFVPERFRGHGTGRALCEAIVDAARQAGFSLMRLDTGDRLTEAIAMYESLGFHQCDPHHAYPPELMRFLVFMEKSLTDA